MSLIKPQKIKNKGFSTKLLPYTPFVSSWPYRTDIFSITRWENRAITDTWLQEVERWKEEHSPLPEDVSELLNNVAKMVDNIEKDLHTNPRLQRACGFSRNGKAKPIGNLNSHIFLPTHLLDIILWSAFDDTEVTGRQLTFSRYHPELALEEPWHPEPLQIAYRFIDFSGERIDSLTNNFLNLYHSTFPTYLPAGHIPTASLSAVDPESSNIPPPQEVEEHPSKWEDSQAFLAHASTAANAMNSKAVAQASIVSCNLWVLISSLIFLIKSQDQEYGKRFAQANRFMVMDSRTKNILEWYFLEREEQEFHNGRGGAGEEGEEEREDEEGEENDQESGIQTERKGKGKVPKTSKQSHFASERLVLAAAALCHSPIFVLDPLIDLSRQNERRMVPYHDLSLKNILTSSFDPSPTNTRATASEKTLWKLIIQTMAESLGSRALASQIPEPQQKSSSDMAPLLHSVLEQELKKTNTLESLTQKIVRLDWPSSSHSDSGNTNSQALSVLPPVSVEQVPRRSTRETVKKSAFQASAQNKGKGRAEPQGPEQETDAQEPAIDTLGGDDEEGEDELNESIEEPTNSPSSSQSKSTRISRKGKKSASRKKTEWKSKSHQQRHVDVRVEIQSEDEESSTKTQPRGGKKRKHVRFTSDNEVQHVAKKPRKLERLSDTTYSWTTHIDIKLERADKLQPVPPESPKLAAKTFDFMPTWEDDLVKEGQEEDDSKISVIRHVLLLDGTFHRETITFTVAWPEDYRQKTLFWSLLKNSRPAERDEGYAAKRAEESVNNMNSSTGLHKSILPFSHFDCLKKRTLNFQEVERRELEIASSPRLIIRPRSREEIREAYVLPILDTEDIWKNLYVNVWIQRQVHDTRKLKLDGKLKHLRSGSIQDVIEQDRRAMNMLDIPNPNLSLPNFIRKLSLDSLGGPLTEGSGFPFTTMKWNLCATQPAVTDLHYDSGKVGTWIHMLKGTKIWFVLDGDIPDKGLIECDPRDLKFVYYVLEEGSIFTMPPGTVHAVLNVTDCFAEGGHMFLSHALNLSFNIGLREHLKGVQDTNTVHIQAEAVLHGIWTHFYTMIVHEHAWIKGCLRERWAALTLEIPKGKASTRGNITYESLREKNPTLPETEDMVSLLCMCVHAMAFEPQVPEEEQPKCPESIRSQRIQSRERAEECLFWIEDVWGPLQEYETKISENLKKSPFNIQMSGVEYVINPLIDPKTAKPKKGPGLHVQRKTHMKHTRNEKVAQPRV